MLVLRNLEMCIHPIVLFYIATNLLHLLKDFLLLLISNLIHSLLAVYPSTGETMVA